MANVDYSTTKSKVLFGDDSAVIIRHFADINGGRALDVADWALDYIPAGTIITKADGVYKPLAITAGEGEGEFVYDTVAEGTKFAGVLYRSISKSRPAASILTWGIVNKAIAPFGLTEEIIAAVNKDVPHVEFTKADEEGDTTEGENEGNTEESGTTAGE